MAKKSIAKNYAYNLIYQVLTLILPLITTPYTARVLGAEKIGIYGYTNTNVSYFILFGSLGVALYGQREIAYARENIEKRMKTFVEIVSFRFVTVFIASLIYFFAFMIQGEYKVYYSILFIALAAVAFDISWFFQGLEEFKKTVLRNIIVRLSSITLIFLLVKTPEDLTKFILIYSLADFIGNLSLWLYLPKYFKGQKIKNLNLIKHILPILLLFIPQIANQVYNMLDKTMIGYIIPDKAEVGYYEQAQKVIRILITIVTSLGVVMIPRMASTFASGNKEKVNEYMKKSFNFVFFLSFPLIFGIISISKEFVPIFFGQGYDEVVTLINIISPVVLLMGIANVIGTQYLLPTKRQKEYTISVTAGLIINFFLNWLLISKWGALGASIATVLSQLVVDLFQLKNIKNEIDLISVFKTSIKYLFAGLIMFAFCLVVNLLNLVGWTAIIVKIIVGMMVYFGLLLIFKDEYIYAFITKIFNIIKSKVKNK
ncbi:MAG: flippase [Clostridia bacterium]|nr:flippase [Clostridia bacterium]